MDFFVIILGFFLNVFVTVCWSLWFSLWSFSVQSFCGCLDTCCKHFVVLILCVLFCLFLIILCLVCVFVNLVGVFISVLWSFYRCFFFGLIPFCAFWFWDISLVLLLLFVIVWWCDFERLCVCFMSLRLSLHKARRADLQQKSSCCDVLVCVKRLNSLQILKISITYLWKWLMKSLCVRIAGFHLLVVIVCLIVFIGLLFQPLSFMTFFLSWGMENGWKSDMTQQFFHSDV